MTDHSQPKAVTASEALEKSAFPRAPTTPLGTQEVGCDTHGTYVSTGHRLNIGRIQREIWTGCPGCAAVADAAAAAVKQAEGFRKAAERHQVELGLTAIPLRFHDRTLETFVATTTQQTHALTIARDYIEQFADNRKRGLSLIFSGGPGAGKSHLAAAIMLALMGKYCVRYMTCMDMIRGIRDTWRKESERSELEVLARLGDEIDLLVLDEIGVQYGTEAEQTLLFDVLDRRYRNMLPTILLTNQDKPGFRGFVGDRVMDRMTETAKWVPFAWDSYRPTARKEAASS